MFGVIAGISFVVLMIACGIIQIYCKQVEKLYEIQGLDLDLITILILSIGGMIGVPFFCGFFNMFIDCVKKHFIAAIVVLVIELIIELIIIAKVLCSDWKKVIKLMSYKKKLYEIEEKLDDIKDMKRDIREDSVFEGDKDKYLKTLYDAEEALKQAYKDITAGIQAIELLGTFNGISNLVSDESKEDLEREIDVLNAYKELSDVKSKL